MSTNPQGDPVLLADTEPIFGDLVEAYLSARGYRVQRARDGRRALDVLAEQRVHVLVASLDLPGLDGLELAACAAQLAMKPPVVLTTRDPGVAAWEPARLEQLGLFAVVQRPCRLGGLIESIERATGQRAPRPSLTARAVSSGT